MKCIIIEDEIPAQKVLKHYIAKLDGLDLIGTYQSALSANDLLRSETVDLIFMDINLPDISGIQFLKTIQVSPRVIMTTAYPSYAAESYELDQICDYLVKPFSFERFLKAVNKAGFPEPLKMAASEVRPGLDPFFINVDKTLHRIQPEEILFLQSDKNYITLVTVQKKWSFLDSLKNWTAKLPENFMQVHKSYVINLKEVEKISGNRITIGTQVIPVGRTYKSTLYKKLNIS